MSEKVSVEVGDIAKPAGLPQGLADYSKSRTDDVVNRLRKEMATIETELDENEGLYPYNGGRLNQAEVCRRAGMRSATLQGKAHKTTTRVMVETWLARVRTRVIKGSRSVRRTVTDRADHWKDAHRTIANAYHLDQLIYEKAQKHIKTLEADNEKLREQISAQSAGKIVSIRRKKE